MACVKAAELLTLATMAVSYRYGVALDDVVARFGCSERTARSMVQALESVFPDVDSAVGDDGRRRWRLASGRLKDLMSMTAEAFADVDLAVRTLEREGQLAEAARLAGLRDEIRALVPPTRARRIAVEVAAPERLRRLCHRFRRSDFPALP